MKYSVNLSILLTCSLLTLPLTSCGEKEKAEDPYNSESNKTLEKPVTKSHDEVQQEEVSTYEELGNTLAGVTDMDSARAAIPDLTNIAFKFNRIKTDWSKAGDITPEQQTQLKEKYASELRDAKTKVVISLKKLQATAPEAYKFIGELMQSISQ